jgi:ketosteroid isomerase-like protein
VPSKTELLRQVYDALARRDFEVLAGLADPDFEMDLTDRVLNPATYRGADGLARFLEEVDELWASMDLAVERVLERGDEALEVLRVRLQGRGSGVELDDRVAQLWTLRDGKLVRMRLRQNADAALAEFEAGG